eukprot:GFUD01015271.1.p1 GENE.GFUD01015271.1~~GFUD01015271.1.p1  ORF type:complete len:227 (+),score=96.26 GFUD01015271.1:291-971(+)
MELLEQTRLEYEGETARCRGVLAGVGQGVEESISQGPAQAYSEVVAGLCSSLELDTSNTVGIETAVSDLLVRQAEKGPSVGKVKGEVERMRSDTVGLYERLARLGEVVEMASKDEREEAVSSTDLSRKLEYIVAKCADYRKAGERGEGVLARNGGNEDSVKHKEIVRLSSKLVQLEEETEPLTRQLQGFLALPPSNELARVELAKSSAELEELEKQVAGQISSLHV